MVIVSTPNRQFETPPPKVQQLAPLSLSKASHGQPLAAWKSPRSSGPNHRNGHQRGEGIGALQDRTHRGGAVLWFLRRHAPMPSKFTSGADATIAWNGHEGEQSQRRQPSLNADEADWSKQHSVGSQPPWKSKFGSKDDLHDISTQEPSYMESGASVSLQSGVSGGSFMRFPRPPAAKRSRPKVTGPQQAFLHQTLLAIGLEVDEHSSCRLAMGFQSSQRSEIREQLRGDFTAHTGAECETLEARVKTREAAVKKLSLYVLQLERMLESTRAAASRRTCRLGRRGSADAGTEGTSPDSRRPTYAVGEGAEIAGMPSPHSSESPSRKTGICIEAAVLGTEEDTMDKKENEWLDRQRQATLQEKDPWEGRAKTVADQRSIENQLEWENKAGTQKLMQMIINRKVTEASLLGSHAQVLKLRTRAIREEKRATQLANELKRVLKSMPHVVEQQLHRLAIPLEGQRNGQLALLCVKFQEQRLKYMPSKMIREERAQWEAKLAVMTQALTEATRSLEDSKAGAFELSSQGVTVVNSLSDLSDAWAGMSAGLAERDDLAGSWNEFDDAQESLEKAHRAANSIRATLCQTCGIEASVGMSHRFNAESHLNFPQV